MTDKCKKWREKTENYKNVEIKCDKNDRISVETRYAEKTENSM